MSDDAKVAVLARAVLSGQITRREMLRRAVALGVPASGIAALLAACGGGSTATNLPAAATSGTSANAAGATTPKAAGKPGGELTFGLNPEPDNFDSAVTPFAVSHTVMMNIYDPLVWRGKDGTFSPRPRGTLGDERRRHNLYLLPSYTT